MQSHAVPGFASGSPPRAPARAPCGPWALISTAWAAQLTAHRSRGAGECGGVGATAPRALDATNPHVPDMGWPVEYRRCGSWQLYFFPRFFFAFRGPAAAAAASSSSQQRGQQRAGPRSW
jgi:hypothetical protein